MAWAGLDADQVDAAVGEGRERALQRAGVNVKGLAQAAEAAAQGQASQALASGTRPRIGRSAYWNQDVRKG